MISDNMLLLQYVVLQITEDQRGDFSATNAASSQQFSAHTKNRGLNLPEP